MKAINSLCDKIQFVNVTGGKSIVRTLNVEANIHLHSQIRQ